MSFEYVKQIQFTNWYKDLPGSGRGEYKDKWTFQ